MVSVVPTQTLNCMRVFSFFVKKILLRYHVFWNFAKVKGRSQLYQRGALISIRVFLFLVKNIFLLYRFLEVVQVKGRYQWYQRGDQNRMRVLSFFGPKKFLQYIVICMSHM